MFGCVITLLLINTFYCSLGLPVIVNETLGKSLQLLADHCQNNFLSTQIKNHVNACDITLPAERKIKEKELECLIFYDINTQLCTALQTTKLNPNETYESGVIQAQKLDKTCTEAAKNWKFTNLTMYPKYYNTSQIVYKNKVKCLQSCGVDDLFSEDANFYCKYYQWGTELLQPLLAGGGLTDNVTNGDHAIVSEKIVPTAPNSSPSQNGTIIHSANELSQPDNIQEQASAQVEIPKLSAQDDLDNAANKLVENSGHSNNEHLNDPKPAEGRESPVSALETQGTNSVKNNTGPHLVSNDLLSKPKPAQDPNSKPGQEDQNLDTIDDNDEGLAYDSDSLDDPPRGPAGDDSDPNLGTDHKQKELKKKMGKNIESIVSSVDMPGAPKDLYTNTMSEQFGEVDDHFFSFFLTATILVIFFYVLYHNKSKFRKVFLGLLVEGRQHGRRRNSRGHEYRRLDTLEQAMSTNSAAPPSKIIY